MRIIIAFSPWITYALLKGVAGWKPAVLASAALALFVLLDGARDTGRAGIFGAVSLAFFGVLAAGSGWLAGTAVQTYAQVLAHGLLTVVMWLTIFLQKPFTESYVQVPAHIAGTPQFRSINNVVSAIWAVTFTVATAVLAYLVNNNSRGTAWVVIISIVVPTLLTRWYLGVLEQNSYSPRPPRPGP